MLGVLVDNPGNRARFLPLGSASLLLVKGVSRSLAGRIGFANLGGFDLREIGSGHTRLLWLRGGFPRSFLAMDDSANMARREDFIRTFLERDIPQFGITIPGETLRAYR
jgi:predicted AAA+ superfamily ATPase